MWRPPARTALRGREHWRNVLPCEGDRLTLIACGVEVLCESRHGGVGGVA